MGLDLFTFMFNVICKIKIRSRNVTNKLTIIRNNAKLQESLENVCDFILSTTELKTSDYLFNVNTNCFIFATDGAGNSFSFLNENNENSPILYVCHEGSYGIVANNLTEFLSLIVSHPYYWQDILNMNRYNKLGSETVNISLLEQDIKQDIPNLNEIQISICNELQINYNPQQYKLMLESVSKYHDYKVYDIRSNSEYERLL